MLLMTINFTSTFIFRLIHMMYIIATYETCPVSAFPYLYDIQILRFPDHKFYWYSRREKQILFKVDIIYDIYYMLYDIYRLASRRYMKHTNLNVASRYVRKSWKWKWSKRYIFSSYRRWKDAEDKKKREEWRPWKLNLLNKSLDW